MMGATNLRRRAVAGRCVVFWLIATILTSLQIGCHGFQTVDLTGRLEGATLQYQINEADPNAPNGEDTITIILEVPAVAWVGFAFNDGSGAMIGSEAVVGLPDEGEDAFVLKYGISRRAANGFVELPNQTLINPMLTQTGETTTLEFTKILIEDGEIPILKDEENSFLAAWGSTNEFAYHAQRAPFTVFLQVEGVAASLAPNITEPSPAPTPEETTTLAPNITSPAPTPDETATLAPNTTAPSPAPTPSVDCLAECETAIEDTDCNAWFLHLCLDDESSICSNSNETQLCSNSTVPDCICDNPPPECEPCEDVVDDADDCFFDYIHSCAATLIDSVCTDNETLIDECMWGSCTCDNPPPPCEPCEDVIDDAECKSDYIHTCAARPDEDPVCSFSPTPEVECGWGNCTCENPPPPCEPCDELLAEVECFNDYIVTCHAAPIVTVCTSNASIGLQCNWGGCVCDNPIPSCPNCTDVLEEARCRGMDTHAHWCAGVDEPLCTESNSTPAEECPWGDWCPACGLDGSTFAPTLPPPTTPAPVVVTPAPVTPAPVDVSPTMAPVDNTTNAPVDNTTEAPVDTPSPATDPPIESPVFLTESPVETDPPVTEPPVTEPPATDPPAGAPDSSAISYYVSKSVPCWFAIQFLALVAYMKIA